MQVLIVSPAKTWVAESPTTVRAAFDATIQLHEQGLPPAPVAVYPSEVKASYIHSTEVMGSQRHVTGMFHNRLIAVTLTDLGGGTFFHPYADLDDGVLSLQLIASDGRLTPFAEHFSS